MSDVHQESKVEQFQKAIDSPGGKLLWRIGELAIAAMVTVAVTSISTNLTAIRHSMEEATHVNVEQDKTLLLLQQKTESLERSSEATILTVQAQSKQLTRNTDGLEHLKESMRDLLRRSRPER